MIARRSASAPLSGSVQVDPSSGLAYAFRGNNAHTLDIQQQSVTESRALIVPFIHCGEPSGVASIDGSLYDPISNTLYLSFLSRACTPHFGYTIHSYDPATWHEWAERDTANRYQAAESLSSGNAHAIANRPTTSER